MKRALGSKKRWTAKVVPVILYVAVALLVIIPLGIQAFIDSAEVAAVLGLLLGRLADSWRLRGDHRARKCSVATGVRRR